MCSPSRFGKPSGNTWRKEEEEEEKEKKGDGEDASSEPLEALLGSI